MHWIMKGWLCLGAWVASGVNDQGKEYRKFKAELSGPPDPDGRRRPSRVTLTSNTFDFRGLPTEERIDLDCEMEINSFDGQNYYNVISVKAAQ